MFIRFVRIHERDRQTDGQTAVSQPPHDDRGALMHSIIQYNCTSQISRRHGDDFILFVSRSLYCILLAIGIVEHEELKYRLRTVHS